MYLVDGTCYGLADGNRVIKLVVAPCDGFTSSDAMSGYESPRSMIITEVMPQSISEGKQSNIMFIINYNKGKAIAKHFFQNK